MSASRGAPRSTEQRQVVASTSRSQSPAARPHRKQTRASSADSPSPQKDKAAQKKRRPDDTTRHALRFHEDLEEGAADWDSEADEDEWEHLSTSSSTLGKLHTHPGTGGGLKRSGLLAKAADLVVAPQLWPHVTLQDEHVTVNLAFKDLDF